MTGDRDNNDMGPQNNVLPFSHADANKIFQEISNVNKQFSSINEKFDSINEKLSDLVRIEEKVLNLTESHVMLRGRVEDMEARERRSERDLMFAVQQAREFNQIKDSISTNIANTDTNKDYLRQVINWIGAIASAVVIAAILNNKEPKTTVYRDAHKQELKVKEG